MYVASGDLVTSPDLRRFLQLEVKMITEDREAAAAIRSIDIKLHPPVAESVVAEVWPDHAGSPGIVDTFDVFVLPSFIERPERLRSEGFDELLLATRGPDMELLEVGIGADRETGKGERVFHMDDGVLLNETGRAVDLIHSSPDSIVLHLPMMQDIAAESPRSFHRFIRAGEQVPVGHGGVVLTAASFALLLESERGDITYFRQRDGKVELVADERAYLALDQEERGPVRYFRILQVDGGQSPFDEGGDLLSLSTYGKLSDDERGAVMGDGELIRLRIAAAVFRNGSTIRLGVRNSVGTGEGAWQSIAAGDATPNAPGNTLSISLPLRSPAIGEVSMMPNPFTPNGDGVNDVMRINFSVFRLTAERRMSAAVYSLDGRRLWHRSEPVGAGQGSITWAGTDDAGKRIAPGVYICRLDLDVDASEQSGTRALRLVNVAY